MMVMKMVEREKERRWCSLSANKFGSVYKYFDEYKCRTYSKDKLDEVKDEWAEYMFTNVIPGGSWIKEFLKT
ncbi:hypothetical protein P8452_59341 [Trifolium repens]|nr:hypothetical protein P8452_59341 [Trifolium repens]